MTLPRTIAKTHSTNPKEGSRDSLTEGQQEPELNEDSADLQGDTCPDQEAAGPPSAMTVARLNFWYQATASNPSDFGCSRWNLVCSYNVYIETVLIIIRITVVKVGILAKLSIYHCVWTSLSYETPLMRWPCWYLEVADRSVYTNLLYLIICHVRRHHQFMRDGDSRVKN